MFDSQEIEMRIVSWNMRRATQGSTAAWNYFNGLEPKLALLQEVNSFPDDMKVKYRILHRKAVGKSGRPQPFGTAIVARDAVLEEMHFATEWEWVNMELEHFQGYFVTAAVELVGGVRIHVMSVHSPVWPIDRESWSSQGLTLPSFKA